MLRVLLRLSTLLLVVLTGCQRDEGRYTDLSARIEGGYLTVRVGVSRTRGDSLHPCAPGLSATPRVNGIDMEGVEGGGGDPIPDSDREDCRGLEYRLKVELLPTDSETLDITFDPVTLSGGGKYPEARAWHVLADWSPARVWSEDDLAARVRANEEFEVRWEPADAPVPEIDLRDLENGKWTLRRAATRVSTEPGRARFRISGPEPEAVWILTARRALVGGATLCSGFESCSVSGSGAGSLHPVGFSPAAPDGVAPPRQCIGAPGTESRDYQAPSWFALPDLARFHVARDASCGGADLYFVVLGACGLCGGGKATYVVGNRGTGAASFSVSSNQETVAGDVVEPQQVSAPYEISFEGALSQIEIASDGDCDEASNAQWVANVVCKRDSSQQIDSTFECNNRCRL